MEKNQKQQNNEGADSCNCHHVCCCFGGGFGSCMKSVLLLSDYLNAVFLLQKLCKISD